MNKEIQKQALAHYDRMIVWVENEGVKLSDKPNFYLMKGYLNENWFGKHCSYCQYSLSDCSECILSDDEYDVSWHENCCGTLWLKMNESKTWKTWLKYAKLVRKYIEENGV